MNEFLHTLRSNAREKRYKNLTRRHYDSNQYYSKDSNDRRQGNGKVKKGNYKVSENFAISADNFDLIKGLIEEVVENQTEMLQLYERRALAEERKAAAIEGITLGISKIAGLPEDRLDEIKKDIQKNITERVSDRQDKRMNSVLKNNQEDIIDNEIETEEEEDIIDDDPDHDDFTAEHIENSPNKEEIMGIITKMRDKGSTYDQIAVYLSSRNLPTFSGRGSWHAQTIHRLYQKS